MFQEFLSCVLILVGTSISTDEIGHRLTSLAKNNPPLWIRYIQNLLFFITIMKCFSIFKRYLVRLVLNYAFA